jgi:hypothetical protein
MPTAAQYRLERTIEIAVPLVQAITALLAGIAVNFADSYYVPWWLTVMNVVVALALIGASAIWSWKARRALAASYSGSPLASVGWEPGNDARWLATSIAAVSLVVLVSAPSLVLGLQPAPDYNSPYDGQDPTISLCADSADPDFTSAPAELRDSEGRAVGRVELRRSLICNTVWAKVIFSDGAAAASVIGSTARIEMNRPGDGKSAVYSLPLSGGPEGFGNMLSNSEACVLARVSIAPSDNSRVGPEAETECE